MATIVGGSLVLVFSTACVCLAAFMVKLTWGWLRGR